MEATIKTTNWNISTHALTEGDLAGNSSDDSRIFQLTPSRRATEKDFLAAKITLFQLTPSRRATFSATGRRSSSIFQLTPSRRATRQHIFNMQRKEYFNSRPHGGRLYRIQFNQLPESISTHALTEGDIPHLVLTLINEYFNSRPHGGRLFPALLKAPDAYFNSRPHGGRHSFFKLSVDECVFQLTPSRRATGSFHAFFEPGYFNSRPHGGRPRATLSAAKSEHFNSRPHGGRRQI